MDPNFIEVNEITDIRTFLMSIDWKNEWWLLAVGVFHIFISACALFVSLNFQIVIFFSLLLLVYFSEFLNEIAAQNAFRFSKQQYFDANGLFISIVFCCPILINCIFFITRWIMMSFELMTKVKTAQLKQQRDKRNKELSANHAKSD